MPKIKHVWYVVYSFAEITGTSGFGAVDILTDFPTVTTSEHVRAMRDLISARIDASVIVFSWTYLRPETIADEKGDFQS